MNETKYRQALGRHDWYYDYTDDHSVWRKGSESYRELCAARREIDPDGAIWNLFAPAAYRISNHAVEAA